MAAYSPSSRSDRESNMDDRIEDSDRTDEVEALDGVRTRDTDGVAALEGVWARDTDEDSSLLYTRLDGVGASDDDDTDMGRGGMGVSAGKGDIGSSDASGDGVSGIVLSRSKDEKADPLGLRNDVSKELSGPSWRARDRTDGEGSSCEDS